MSAGYDFFIAHASADSVAAKRLYDLLIVDHSVFLDAESLLPGDAWDDELPRAQRASRVTIVLISSKSEPAYYERDEIHTAIALNRKPDSRHRIVPVYLDLDDPDSRDDILYGLRRIHGIFLSQVGSFEAIANRLAVMLQRLRERTQRVDSLAARSPTVNPTYTNSELPESADEDPSHDQSPFSGDLRSDRPFLMPIEDVVVIKDRGPAAVATGRVARGSLKIGDRVEVIGFGLTRDVIVGGIEMHRKLLDEAGPGDIVGLLLHGEKKNLRRGQVLAKPKSIRQYKRFQGHLIAPDNDSMSDISIENS